MHRIKLTLAMLAVLCATTTSLWSLTAVKGQSAGLAPPTGVAASDGSYTNKIGISWDVMRGATRYQVFRNTTNDPAAAVSLGTTVEAVFYDVTAVAGQTYFYWVRAENAQGASGLSAPATGTRANGTMTGLNPPPAPAGNPVTATKAALGKVLFWDEQLSSTRTVACGTCHLARSGGSDPRSLTNGAGARHPGADNLFGTADDIQGSPGVPLTQANGSYAVSAAFGLREQVTKRRSVPQINSGYPDLLFWEGRAPQEFRDPLTNAVVLSSGAALESQALEPVISEVEMGHKARNWSDVAARVVTIKPLALAPSIPAALAAWMGERRYPELFNEAFGTPDVTPVRIVMALSTYQRTLNSDRAPVDSGDLTAQEARGRQVYNSNDCNDCHAAPLFGTNQFQNTGVRPSAEDAGRFAVTNNQNDLGRFRAVSLRNVELRAPYMHNGRFNTLEDVVEFYNRGGDFPGPNTNREIRRLNLTAQQKADLVAFLKRPLTDPRVAAELPPFDRPLLYAESIRVPQITGSGIAGTSGNTPQPVAIEPPILGNPRFTVAVQNALGGATATLVIDENDPGATANLPASASFARTSVLLNGTGAGKGHGSVSLAIPDHASLAGKTLYGRWYVNDAGAPQGVSVSPAFKFTIFGSSDNTAPAFASVSAASFALGTVAPASILAGFGANLSSVTLAANELPLPEALGGVTVTIKDVLGVERRAPLFFVSPGQVNYELPADVTLGEAVVTIQQNGNIVAAGLLQVSTVSPGLFTADATGRGLAAATVLRVKADGPQSYEPIATFNISTNHYEPSPIDLGAESDQLFLIAFGTGMRNRSALSAVTATMGGSNADVSFAGAQGSFTGLDQINIAIPRSLAGRGSVDVVARVDEKNANTITITIK